MVHCYGSPSKLIHLHLCNPFLAFIINVHSDWVRISTLETPSLAHPLHFTDDKTEPKKVKCCTVLGSSQRLSWGPAEFLHGTLFLLRLSLHSFWEPASNSITLVQLSAYLVLKAAWMGKSIFTFLWRALSQVPKQKLHGLPRLWDALKKLLLNRTESVKPVLPLF